MDPADVPGTGRAPAPPKAGAAWLERVRCAARVDLRPGTPPSNGRWVIATAASLVLSVALDALAVRVTTSAFPSTRHFSHFRVVDYGTLTVVGVLVAAGGWAALVRLSSAARWLFLRLAVVVTLLLWVPDVWLFLRGETGKGVVTLMVMHLLVAVVTYNLLVRLAPAGTPPPVGASADADALTLSLGERAVRRIWSGMAALVALELALGVAVIVSVPFRRPAAVLPARGTWIYAVHGAVGIALGAGALGVLGLSTVAGRIGRIGAVMGAIGVVVGLGGGVFSTFQATRLLGMAVMLVGVVVAGVGYLAPSLEALGKSEAARAEAARAAIAGTRAGTGGSSSGPGPGAGDGVSANGHGATPRAR
jgi:hypothetical protein